jgi:hypothetical protein
MPCESEDMTWLYAESMRGFTWKREKKEARMMDGWSTLQVSAGLVTGQARHAKT